MTRPSVGRWTVCIGSGIVCALGGAQLWGATLGVFMLPLQQSFGWTRADIALGITFMTFTVPALAPLAGWMIDRVDLRRLVLVCLALQAGVLAAAGQVGAQIAGFYALCVAMAAVSYGASALPLSKIVTHWFDEGRGRALGLMFALASLGPVVHPLVAQSLIVQFGWRTAYHWMALIVALVGGLVAWFCIHDRAPAAAQLSPAATTPTAAPASAGMRDLLRDPAWWALAAWGALYAFGFGLIGLHLVPMLSDRGASPAQAAMAMSLLGLGVLAGNLVAGALFDKLPTRATASVLMLAPVVAALILQNTPGVQSGIAACVLLGLAAGGESSALTYLVGRCFAPQLYGRAYALQTVPLALAAGIGPWVSGVLYGRNGNYELPLGIAAASFALAALAPWLLPRDRVAPHSVRSA